MCVQRLEEAFVQMRGKDAGMNGEQFHHMLCTARLLSLSHGCSSLSPEVWARTCELEKCRLDRIKNTD